MDVLYCIYCPECGDEVEPDAPERDIVPGGGGSDYRHMSDRTPLCSVPAPQGSRPAAPSEVTWAEPRP